MPSVSKRRRVRAVPVLGAVALAGAAVPMSALPAFAGGAPDGVDADAGRDAEAASGAAARHASDPRVQLRELFGLDASPGRIAELMVEGHHDPTSPWLMTPEEAAQVEGQLASQERLTVVQGDLRAGLGAAFAGVSIDQTDHGRITVKVAGDVEASAVVALVRGLVPTAGDVDVDRVDYGLDELEALAASIAPATATIKGVVGANVDEATNRVEISVTDLDDAARGDVDATTRDDPRVRVVEIEHVQPMADMDPGDGTRWANPPVAPVGLGNCSIAFGIRGTAPTTTGNYAVTSGHCTNVGVVHRSRGGPDFLVGTGSFKVPTPQHLQPMADVGLIKLASGVRIRNTTKFIGDLTLQAPVTSAPSAGTVACKWGAASGLTCGTVANVHQPVYIGAGPSLWIVREANRVVYDSGGVTVKSGDSGGLVFALGTNNNARALGIVIGGNPDGAVPGGGNLMENGGGNEMFFSDWGSIVDEIGPHYAFGNK